MMCPRRPTTRTRSSPWLNSNTEVPSTFVRFAFPSLRMVAMRTAALNFSVTISRRTEGFAGNGLYLIVCCPMSSKRDSSRARFPCVRARGGSGASARIEGPPNLLRGLTRIGRVHDRGDDRNSGDAVLRETAGVLLGNASNRKDGKAGTLHDLVEKAERQDRLLGFRGAGRKRSHGQVVCARARSCFLFPCVAIHRHANDRPRSEDQSGGSGGRILAAYVDAVRPEATCQL